MQIGLLGKANVGKSTFFSAATHTPVPTGNFPFTTIQPNVGVAHVEVECACRSLGVRHRNRLCVGGTRLIPLKLVDIAGLVPGAHEGKGLGNRFLDDARQADALIHVVDIAGSTDIQGRPVGPGVHDPLLDVEFVKEEFDRWFLDILLRGWDKLARDLDQKIGAVAGIARRFSGLGVGERHVQQALQEAGLSAKRAGAWTDAEMRTLAATLRRLVRPMLVAANKADLCRDLSVIERIGGYVTVPCSAEAELLLQRAADSGLVRYGPGSDAFSVQEGVQISAPQRRALDAVRGVLSRLGGTGIRQALNRTVFDVLGFVAVYPVEDETRLTNRDGEMLPDAKLLPGGSGPRELAAAVHADIAEGFLYGIDCRTRQRIGAEHVLKSGDVIKIVSTGSRGA